MPAAAVIPAPIAYINVVAVKKLVVGFWDHVELSADWYVRFDGLHSFQRLGGPSLVCGWVWVFYFEKIRVFKAGLCSE